MDTRMIGKNEKAKRYAEELDRIRFDEFKVTLEGDNGTHLLSYCDQRWSCDCRFFASRGMCSHTMAMERVLGVMLPAPEEEPVGV